MSAPSFTRSEMPVDGRENDSSYLSLPTEIAPGHSVIDIVTPSSSDTGLFLSRGQFPEDEDWGINHWPLDIPLNPHNSQANEEAGLLAYPEYFAGPHPPIQTTPTRSTDEQGVTLLRAEDLVNTTHEDDPTVIRSLSPMLRTTALPEFAPAACMPIDLARVNIECGRHHEGTPMNVHPIQDLRYTHTDETTELSVPSIPPMIPNPLPVAVGNSQEQRSPQDRQQGSQWAGMQSVIMSSRSSRRPAGIRRDPMGRYSCEECGKSYSQPQGTRRHQRETHDSSVCLICHNFEWARPYLLKKHLEKKHSDVDINGALDEAMRTRRKVTDFTSHHRD